MESMNDYERRREMNIQENRQKLIQLGLLKPEMKQGTINCHSKAESPLKEQTIRRKSSETSPYQCARKTVRKSLSDTDDYEDDVENGHESINDDYESSIDSPPASEDEFLIGPNVYGSIEGVQIGDWWLTSLECSTAGVHRSGSSMAGVHCGPEGAYSIALSRDFEDDVDGGEKFTYSGSGDRKRTRNFQGSPQASEQIMEYDLSLVASMESKNPVRVIRGYRLQSAYAPEFGYRYDGLYQVENYWAATGKEGFTVYKFLLKRCCNQDPPPWVVHKILPTSINRALRIRYANTLRTLKSNINASIKSKTHKLGDLKKKSLNKSSSSSHGAHNGFVNSGIDSNNLVFKGARNRQSMCNSNRISSNCSSNIQKSFKDLLERSSTSPSKHPLRMQALNSPSTSAKANDAGIDQSSKKGISKNLFDTDTVKSHKKQKLSISNQLSECSSSDELFTDDLSFLNTKKRSFYESLQGQPGSFEEEFFKICEELCNELPRPGKRIKFSIDNDPEPEESETRERRKQFRKVPRKSSLSKSREHNHGKRFENQHKQEEEFVSHQKFAGSASCLLNSLRRDVVEKFNGLDSDTDEFLGFTSKEVLESKELSTRFADFLFRLCEASGRITGQWTSCDPEPRRAIIVNGFLIEQVQSSSSLIPKEESE